MSSKKDIIENISNILVHTKYGELCRMMLNEELCDILILNQSFHIKEEVILFVQQTFEMNIENELTCNQIDDLFEMFLNYKKF